MQTVHDNIPYELVHGYEMEIRLYGSGGQKYIQTARGHMIQLVKECEFNSIPYLERKYELNDGTIIRAKLSYGVQVVSIYPAGGGISYTGFSVTPFNFTPQDRASPFNLLVVGGDKVTLNTDYDQPTVGEGSPSHFDWHSFNYTKQTIILTTYSFGRTVTGRTNTLPYFYVKASAADYQLVSTITLIGIPVAAWYLNDTLLVAMFDEEDPGTVSIYALEDNQWEHKASYTQAVFSADWTHGIIIKANHEGTKLLLIDESEVIDDIVYNMEISFICEEAGSSITVLVESNIRMDCPTTLDITTVTETFSYDPIWETVHYTEELLEGTCGWGVTSWRNVLYGGAALEEMGGYSGYIACTPPNTIDTEALTVTRQEAIATILALNGGVFIGELTHVTCSTGGTVLVPVLPGEEGGGPVPNPHGFNGWVLGLYDGPGGREYVSIAYGLPVIYQLGDTATFLYHYQCSGTYTGITTYIRNEIKGLDFSESDDTTNYIYERHLGSKTTTNSWYTTRSAGIQENSNTDITVPHTKQTVVSWGESELSFTTSYDPLGHITDTLYEFIEIDLRKGALILNASDYDGFDNEIGCYAYLYQAFERTNTICDHILTGTEYCRFGTTNTWAGAVDSNGNLLLVMEQKNMPDGSQIEWCSNSYVGTSYHAQYAAVYNPKGDVIMNTEEYREFFGTEDYVRMQGIHVVPWITSR